MKTIMIIIIHLYKENHQCIQKNCQVEQFYMLTLNVSLIIDIKSSLSQTADKLLLLEKLFQIFKAEGKIFLPKINRHVDRNVDLPHLMSRSEVLYL